MMKIANILIIWEYILIILRYTVKMGDIFIVWKYKVKIVDILMIWRYKV